MKQFSHVFQVESLKQRNDCEKRVYKLFFLVNPFFEDLMNKSRLIVCLGEVKWSSVFFHIFWEELKKDYSFKKNSIYFFYHYFFILFFFRRLYCYIKNWIMDLFLEMMFSCVLKIFLCSLFCQTEDILPQFIFFTPYFFVNKKNVFFSHYDIVLLVVCYYCNNSMKCNLFFT